MMLLTCATKKKLAPTDQELSMSDIVRLVKNQVPDAKPFYGRQCDNDGFVVSAYIPAVAAEALVMTLLTAGAEAVGVSNVQVRTS